MVDQHFGIDIRIIMLHVIFILFWKYLRLTIEVVLVHLEEWSIVVRDIVIVFILGLIDKFLLNGDIKCTPFGIFFWAVEFRFGECSELGLGNYLPI